MDVWDSKVSHITDAHVHMWDLPMEQTLMEIREATGTDRINLVSIQFPETGKGLPEACYMKAKYPGTFYVFAGLNHAMKITDGAVQTKTLAEQVDDFVALGCEGIKMIEGKPAMRRDLNVPMDSDYFADYWARVDEVGLPITWHVADPEEFWEPALLPAWAQEKGWGYGPDMVGKEQLYSEVDHVLARHPNLKIIFAHFYFLSADLPRASRFLEAHPYVHIDLTPGIEMLYNMSHDVDATRDFFITWADRIVYGTDIMPDITVEEARLRAGIVHRWLESDDTYRIPETVDMLLGKPEDGVIRGLSLPDDVLQRIYRDNFARLAGAAPKPLNRGKAIATCHDVAAIAEAMSGAPAAESDALQVAGMLEQL
ncbi:MAG: amidohydrolase family protein [Anaerolineae bacterium]|nr:amidohydrolase family protein [Anaerolineae bacterium]